MYIYFLIIYLSIYLFTDEYLYRIKTLQQYRHKHVNTTVITVCPT